MMPKQTCKSVGAEMRFDEAVFFGLKPVIECSAEVGTVEQGVVKGATLQIASGECAFLVWHL